MRSIKFSLTQKSTTSWDAAVFLMEAYLGSDRKADQLLDALPSNFIGARRASCQSLFLGALRHGHRTRAALRGLLHKKTKAAVEAILLVAGYELLDADEARYPKIIHHAVERSKMRINRFEQRFLNAVLRKLPPVLDRMDPHEAPAAYYSHPKWLVDRWRLEFPASLTQLLEWNQHVPSTYIKLYDAGTIRPKGLEPTSWPGFYKITGQASWADDLRPLLNRGNAYIKDPSTRLAPALLAPEPGESVLDLCAAPGGKAYDMAHAMNEQGQIVAVDLPGPRIHRLQQNLDSLRNDNLHCAIVEADLLTLNASKLQSQKLPSCYDAVMLDAPCSNTGVIQRRTDVKWRLQAKDIEACAQLQLKLLQVAASYVKPGGRLVYGTCSIEERENRHVVDAFLQSASGQNFQLLETINSYPWETGHDGAGAFLLKNR